MENGTAARAAACGGVRARGGRAARGIVVGALLGATALASSAAGGASVQEVTLRSDDGYELAATYFFPTQGNARGVVLVHMLARDRFSWKILPYRLQASGFAVLAIDLRGHGQSLVQHVAPDDAAGADEAAANGDAAAGAAAGAGTQEPMLREWRDFAKSDFGGMVADVDAALDFLAARPEVDQGHLAVVGAGLGAGVTLAAARTDRRIGKAVLLSPTLEGRVGGGAEAIEPVARRADVLMVTSRSDRRSHAAALRLAEIGGEDVLLKVYDNVGTGTNMLFYQPLIEDLVADFLAAGE